MDQQITVMQPRHGTVASPGVRFWIRSIPPAYVVVIALSLAALTISAESYADKTASQVLATGSRAQITPPATVVEYAEVALRAPATLSPAISKANNSKNLAILWSDESIVAIGLKGKLNASSPLETDVIDRSTIASVRTFRNFSGHSAKPSNGVTTGSLTVAWAIIVTEILALGYILSKAKQRARATVNLQNMAGSQEVLLRLNPDDAESVSRAYREDRGVILSYFIRRRPKGRIKLPKFFWPTILVERFIFREICSKTD